METMSDVETLNNNYDIKVSETGVLSDVGTIFNVKFLSHEICVGCPDMSEVGVSDVEV